MPRELVRHLVLKLIPAEDLTPLLTGEGPRSYPLQGAIEEYSDWDLVSHTFNLRGDDTAIVALIFEQKARRAK